MGSTTFVHDTKKGSNEGTVAGLNKAKTFQGRIVFDSKKGSNEGIIAGLNKAGIFKGDPRYEKLLINLTDEQQMFEHRAAVDKQKYGNLQWDVIVDRGSCEVIITSVFEKEIINKSKKQKKIIKRRQK